MAQPNVAREPSMDEILASIRKIIENNEAQPDLAADTQEDAGFDIAVESRSNLLDRPAVVEPFHAEEYRSAALEPLARVEPAPGAQPATSLADVAARVRAASERHVAANRDQAEQAQPAQSAQREESPLVTARMTAGNHPASEPAKEEIAATAPAAEPVTEPEAQAAAPGRDLAALVSPAVGERVAQSFGALAEAVDAGPRRSFDETAEDMLRPMLQEWLDDNLPTLVERLVREEIERVARGPRR